MQEIEKQWQLLATSAGMKAIKLWYTEVIIEEVVEIMLSDEKIAVENGVHPVATTEETDGNGMAVTAGGSDSHETATSWSKPMGTGSLGASISWKSGLGRDSERFGFSCSRKERL